MQSTATIFTPDFMPIDEVNFEAMLWFKRSEDFGEFRMWVPLNIDNAKLLRKENLIWAGGEEMGVIEGMKIDKNHSHSFAKGWSW